MPHSLYVRFICLPIVIGFLLTSCSNNRYSNWSVYLGDLNSSQYSPLDEINTENVNRLRIIWQYSSQDADSTNRSQIQCNPLVIDGILYGTSARLKLFALDAASGEERWMFDPFDQKIELSGAGVNRGIAYHADGEDRRIFFSAGDRLFCINAQNGLPISEFGENGSIDLHTGLGPHAKDLSIYSTTPGLVYKDMIIMGSTVSESVGAAPGHIRAFDIKTGAQRWIFHTIPHPGEFGYDTWPEDAYLKSGGANVWAGFSLDKDRGILYCPTGSAAFDFYGGDRHGANLFANCIIALNASTGQRIWHFQTIHHDIWDKDLPAPPNLVTIQKDGKKIDALAQITKNGILFIFNRETGEPVFPIEEVPVEPSTLKGEAAWPTQPRPTHYPPYARSNLTVNDLAQRSPEASRFAKTIWEESLKGSPYIPPSTQGTIIFPGFDGGGEWGGAAYDPVRGNMYINSSEMPWRVIMDEVTPAVPGEQTYKSLCQNCHGQGFEGNDLYGNIPSLIDLKHILALDDVQKIVQQGVGIMPAFSYLDDQKIKEIYDFINGDTDQYEKVLNPDWPYPYSMRGYEKLYAPDGFPMIKPPWGQLTSYDLNNARINWQVALGEHLALTKMGIPVTGTENYGGPVVTAGGLVFIASTMDEKIRAFDKNTGEELWSHQLPAAGYATPAIYAIDGRQYVVIACGGGKLGTKSGDNYLAFALE